MKEETKKLKTIVREAITKVDWLEPTVLGAKGKVCECKPGPYTYDSTPSYATVCDESGYIKECDDC